MAPLLLPIFALSGCSSDAGVPSADEALSTDSARGRAVARGEAPRGIWHEDPEARWSLEEELRIGAVEGDQPYVFGRIRNLIPALDGGVWIYDQQAFELRRFGANGEHILSVGRRGEGPGEFSGNACARRGTEEEIWVETETNWHRFNRDGQLIGTFPTPSTIACGVRAWLPDGRYLAVGSDYDWETQTQHLYFVVLEWVSGAFVPVDTIMAPDVPEPETITWVSSSGRSRSTRSIPFVHNPGWGLERGGVFWAWNGRGDYDIRLQSMRGDTIRRISRPYSSVRIEKPVRREAIRDFNRPGWRAETDFDVSRVPDVYPPFSSVQLSEDQSVWVRRQTGEGTVSWDIFSDDDRYLGELDIPEELAGMSLRYVGEDHVWGILRDDLGVQYVVRARIVKGS